MKPRLSYDFDLGDLNGAFNFWDKKSAIELTDLIVQAINEKREIPALGIATLSLRSAFDAFLKSLEDKWPRKIIFSALNIDGMREIAIKNGFEIIAIDIGFDKLIPNVQTIEQVLTQSGAKIVLIAQLFGTINSLSEISQVCKKYGAILIEDAAQAFRSDNYGGDENADINLFSFGPIKRKTALGGGVLLAKSPDILARVKVFTDKWPKKSEFWYFKRISKYSFMKLLSFPPIYGFLTLMLRRLGIDVDALVGSSSRGFGKGDIISQIEFKPPASLLRVLHHRLKVLSKDDRRIFNAIETRANIVTEYACYLPKAIGEYADYNSFWLLPILFDKPDKVIELAKNKGIDATQGTTSMRALSEDCLNASQIISKVIYWPFL